MRGCFFSPDGARVYTQATQTRKKSYIVEWRNAKGFAQTAMQCEPAGVVEVHPNTVVGLRVTPDKETVAVFTSDGFVKVLSRASLSQGKAQFTVSQKRHKLPVTCAGFKSDASGDAEWAVFGSSDYMYSIVRCKPTAMSKCVLVNQNVGFVLWCILSIVKLVVVLALFSYIIPFVFTD